MIYLFLMLNCAYHKYSITENSSPHSFFNRNTRLLHCRCLTLTMRNIGLHLVTSGSEFVIKPHTTAMAAYPHNSKSLRDIKSYIV